MDDETLPGPSGYKRRPVKEVVTKKKIPEAKPSKSAASGATGVAKRLRKDVKDDAVKNEDPEPEEPPKKAKAKTMLEIVCEAIESVGDGKKGASAQAITKYVQNEKGPEALVQNYLVNRAISKGIEKGVLSRAKPKAGAVGESRRFVLVKQEKKKEEKKAKTENEKNAKTEGEKAAKKETIDAKKAKTEGEKAAKKETSDVNKKAKTEGEKAAKKETSDVNKKTKTEGEKKTKKETSDKKKVEKQGSYEDGVIKKPPKVVKRLLQDTFVKGFSDTSTPKAEHIKPLKNPIARRKAPDSDLDERKESSDTEIVVKPKRKSMKTYSSDTELNVTTNFKEKNKKKARAAKVKSSQIETQMKPPKSKAAAKAHTTDQKATKEKTLKPPKRKEM